MGTMAKFLKHESLYAVKKDKQVGNKAMFGTNKLCMKGIYLPTFQRSIILRANEGCNKFTQFDNFRRENSPKTCFITCVFIYNIQIYTDFSLLFRQIKRQDTVVRLGSDTSFHARLGSETSFYVILGSETSFYVRLGSEASFYVRLGRETSLRYSLGLLYFGN